MKRERARKIEKKEKKRKRRTCPVRNAILPVRPPCITS